MRGKKGARTIKPSKSLKMGIPSAIIHAMIQRPSAMANQLPTDSQVR